MSDVIRLANYTPPDLLVDAVDLVFHLNEQNTQVHARLSLRRPQGKEGTPLALNGRDLTLQYLAVDGKPLSDAEFTQEGDRLILHATPDAFTLDVKTLIHPERNLSLEGLFLSRGTLCTQCEAEGFRKITYYPDRPDISAPFTTTLIADRERYPTLLANGNPAGSGGLSGGRHWVKWEDPFPKPSYLFALVAGQLEALRGEHVATSGRRIALAVYASARNLSRCHHALACLKKAMAWDEAAYGLECDLNQFNVVAIDDFNMGAMENKGLNLFNAKYLLADQDTATDADFENIDSIVAHEYFHNWTGNRVTLRDWFQLSLKEGLTVFRDQQYAEETRSKAVVRTSAVSALLDYQYPEDAGPTAHPVRPDHYKEINNFYTVTVYEKGAELVRMLFTLLGRETFRKGVRAYLKRFDGGAATVEGFLETLSREAGRDLSSFLLWYGQAGTPVLSVLTSHDAIRQCFTLAIRQRIPPTPEQAVKQPVPIPLAVGLLDENGQEIPLRLEGEEAASGVTRILEVNGESATFHFMDVARPPVPSLLRDHSAPVLLDETPDADRLAFLMAHDPDPVNRWRAARERATLALLARVEAIRQGVSPPGDEAYLTAFARTLADPHLERRLIVLALALPEETALAERMAVADPDAIHTARTQLRREIARSLVEPLRQAHARHRDANPSRRDPESVGRRAMANFCLELLVAGGEAADLETCRAQFAESDNLTDRLSALRALVHARTEEGEACLQEFYLRWEEEPVVVDRWFSLQATCPGFETLGRVEGLTLHPEFDARNPNRVRALLGVLPGGNPAVFHRADGAGYALLSHWIRWIDGYNPQLAARLAKSFSRCRKFDAGRSEKMLREVAGWLASHQPSRDLAEVAEKILAPRS